MGNPKEFIETLKGYQSIIDSGKDLSVNFKNIRDTLADEDFVEEKVKRAAVAAGGVCIWVKNIAIYYDVFVEVEPKKKAVAEMTARLDVANAKNLVHELESIEEYIKSISYRKLSNPFKNMK